MGESQVLLTYLIVGAAVAQALRNRFGAGCGKWIVVFLLWLPIILVAAVAPPRKKGRSS